MHWLFDASKDQEYVDNAPKTAFLAGLVPGLRWAVRIGLAILVFVVIVFVVIVFVAALLVADASRNSAASSQAVPRYDHVTTADVYVATVDGIAVYATKSGNTWITKTVERE